MSAKQEILERIRSATGDVDRTVAASEDTPVAWEYHRPTVSGDVLDLFVERVADYKATVVRCPAGEVGERIVDALRQTGARSVVLPAELDAGWRAAIEGTDVTIRSDEPPLTQVELDGTDAVVTAAAVGAAVSGTIMLDHAGDQGRRALSLVPDVHVCVVRADQVVSDVPEAVGRLRGAVQDRRPITWISGPSATSDIELSRVEGVHGPRTLWVILATD